MVIYSSLSGNSFPKISACWAVDFDKYEKFLQSAGQSAGWGVEFWRNLGKIERKIWDLKKWAVYTGGFSSENGII